MAKSATKRVPVLVARGPNLTATHNRKGKGAYKKVGIMVGPVFWQKTAKLTESRQRNAKPASMAR